MKNIEINWIHDTWEIVLWNNVVAVGYIGILPIVQICKVDDNFELYLYNSVIKKTLPSYVGSIEECKSKANEFVNLTRD